MYITSEKSSKNYISLFQESPPEGYPRGVIRETVPFGNGSSNRQQIQDEDSQ